MDTIIQYLDKLAQLRAERATLTTDIDQQIDALTRQREELTVDVDEQIDATEQAIKSLVIEHGIRSKVSVW